MREVRTSEHNAYQIHYHFVTPVKYRKAIFGRPDREQSLRDICNEIEERYSIEFEQIGIDKDHVHYLLSAAPKFSPSQVVRVLKSVVAREMFKRHPDLREELWGGELWTDGFFVATVGEGGNRDVIREYVRKQGNFDDKQLKLFNFDL
ncbi:MAG: IS200/IS605 family transposase [Elusimicrobia bacterium]|nr:IS200/IS605 family transposase [Candidatus Obscuribacterium magneticum]